MSEGSRRTEPQKKQWGKHEGLGIVEIVARHDDGTVDIRPLSEETILKGVPIKQVGPHPMVEEAPRVGSAVLHVVDAIGKVFSRGGKKRKS